MAVRRGLVFTIGAIGLLSACELPPEQRAAAACVTICECTAPPLPAVQEQCVAECMLEAPDELSDDCLACISGHETCATLERDCEPICDPPEPPVFIVDAGIP